MHVREIQRVERAARALECPCSSCAMAHSCRPARCMATSRADRPGANAAAEPWPCRNSSCSSASMWPGAAAAPWCTTCTGTKKGHQLNRPLGSGAADQVGEAGASECGMHANVQSVGQRATNECPSGCAAHSMP